MITVKQVFIQSVTALFLTAAMGLFIYPVRTFAREEFAQRIVPIYESAEEFAGKHILYDSMTPSLFHGPTLTNVRFHDPGKPDKPIIQMDTLKLSYNFLDFFADPFSFTFLEITIDHMRIDYTHELHWPWLLHIADILLADDPLFTTDRVPLKIGRITGEAHIGDVTIDTNINDADMILNPFLLSVRSSFASSLFLVHSLLDDGSVLEVSTNQPSSLYHSIRLEESSLGSSSLSVDAPGIASFNDYPIFLTIEEEELYLSFSAFNTSLNLTYDFPDQRMQMHVTSDRFNLSDELDVLHAHPVIELLHRVKDAQVNLSVSSVIGEGLSFEDISYRADIRIPEVLMDEASLTALRLEVYGDEDLLTAQTIQGRVNGNPFRFRGSVELEDLSPSGLLEVRIPELLDDEVLAFSLQHGGPYSVKVGFSKDDVSLNTLISYQDPTRLEFSDTLVRFSDYQYAVPFTLFLPELRAISHPEADLAFSLAYHEGTMDLITSWSSLPLPLDAGMFSNTVSSGSAAAAVQSLEQWSFSLERMDIQGIALGDQQADVSFRARGNQQHITIEDITYADGTGLLSGDGSVIIDLHERSMRRASLVLSDAVETYTLSVDNYDGYYYGEVTIDQGRTERIPLPIGSGFYQGSIEFFGPLDALTVTADLDMPEVSSGERVYSLSLTAGMDSTGITIEQGTFRREDFLLDHLEAGFNFADGALHATARVVMETLTEPLVDAVVSADGILGSVDSPFDLFDIQGMLRRSDITLTAKQIRIYGNEVADISPLTLSMDNGDYTIRSTRDDKLFISINPVEKRFAVSAGDQFPIQTNASGMWESDGTFTIFLDDLVLDLTALNALEQDQIWFEEGIVTGYLTITGTMRDPDFYGELTTDEVIVRNPFVKKPMRTANIHMTVHGKEMTFAKFNTYVGTVPIVTRMHFYLFQWVPQYLSIEFTAPQQAFVPSSYTFEAMQLSYDAMLTGNLKVEIEQGTVTVSGDLLVDQAVVSLTGESYQEKPSDFLTNVNLRLTSGKSVQFILPTRELPIMTATLQSQQSIRIVYNSLDDSYQITGQLGIKSGDIYYVRRNFYITSGSIILGEGEEELDPMVSLRAKIREFDRTAQRVDIFMILENQRLSNLNPRFESNPPMPLNEIAQILGESIMLPEQFASATMPSTVALASVATDIIQQFRLFEPLERFTFAEEVIRDTLRLDVFSLRTQLLHNTLMDILPMETGFQSAANPLAKYFDNTTLFMGKYFGDSMFFQTMVVLSANDDISPGLFMTDALKMDVELSFEWQTPLYELTISTQPKLTSFPGIVSDFSVGLAWRFSF